MRLHVSEASNTRELKLAWPVFQRVAFDEENIVIFSFQNGHFSLVKENVLLYNRLNACLVRAISWVYNWPQLG